MADNAEELVDDREEKENLALSVRGEHLGGTARRRNVSGKGKRRNQPTIETDDEEDGTDDDGQSGGFLGTLQKKVGKRAAGGEFSFQVHHHHAPSSSPSNSQLSGQDYGQVGSAPERWLQSNTPYVLLGYVSPSTSILHSCFLELTLAFFLLRIDIYNSVPLLCSQSSSSPSTCYSSTRFTSTYKRDSRPSRSNSELKSCNVRKRTSIIGANLERGSRRWRGDVQIGKTV